MNNISTERDLDVILKNIAEILLLNISAAVASVTIRLLCGENLVLKAVAGGETEGRNEIVSLSNSLAGQAIEQKDVLYIEDIRRDPKYAMTQAVEQAGLVSFLAVPLICRDEPLGVIQIYTKDVYRFSDNELLLAKTFADSVAVNVKSVQTSSKRLDALFQLSNAFSSATNLKEILQVAVRKGAEALGVSRSVIFLVDDDGEEAEIVAGFPIEEHGIGKKFAITDNHGALKKVIFEKKLFFVENPLTDPLMDYAKEFIKDKKIKSVLFLPLMCSSSDEVIGIMVFDATETGDKKYFSQDDINFASSVANVAASHICNEYARQHLSNEEKKLLLDEAASRVAHTIRNSLISIGLSSSRIHKTFDKLLVLESDLINDAHEKSGIISEEVKKLEKILADALRASKLLTLNLYQENINDFIGGIGDSFNEELSVKKIDFKVNLDECLNDLLVKIDKEQLKHALVDLIRNAIDAATDKEFDGERKIFIETLKTRRRVLISVCNTGNPISPSVIPNIFHRFFTTKTDGTGLGLVNVKTIVDVHNGTIEVKSDEIETRFTIKLPI